MAEPTRTRLVQVGEMAGPILRLPAEALRSSGLEVMGSGGGSIPPAAIFETFPRLWELAANGELRIDVEPVPLPDVEQAWQRPTWAAAGWCSSPERGTPDPCHRDHPARPGVKLECSQAPGAR